LNTYEEFKDSGIEWIGEIPKHWVLLRMKYLCEITTGNKDTEDREENGEYPFFVRSPNVERISSFSFDGEAILTAGDGVGVCKVFHYYKGKFDFHQRVYKLSIFKNVIGKYLFYYIKENFIKVVKKISAKSTVDSLRLHMFQNFLIAIGSEEEQTQIAKYLDYKTSLIDKLIEKNEKLIELLEEKRSAIINQAVIKGLNPDVKMKDSGIEWIGEIPEHWKSTNLKHTTNKITDGSHFSPATVEDGYPYITVMNISNNSIDFENCKYIALEDYVEY